MCGRFVQLPLQFGSGLPADVEQALQVVPEKYNLAPTQRAAVVLDEQNAMAVRRFRWGLVPPWCKDLKQTYSTINARIETVAVKPAFRAAWKARRCVVPMRGYYEWCSENGVKQPYFLGLADGRDLFAAAIWEPRHRLQREDEDGSVCIITQDAVDEAGRVHDRMPVFLPASVIGEFMRASSEEAMLILQAAPIPPLTVRKVSRRVNAPRDDDPGLLDEIP